MIGFMVAGVFATLWGTFAAAIAWCFVRDMLQLRYLCASHLRVGDIVYAPDNVCFIVVGQGEWGIEMIVDDMLHFMSGCSNLFGWCSVARKALSRAELVRRLKSQNTVYVWTVRNGRFCMGEYGGRKDVAAMIYRLERPARVIQAAWRRAVTDPAYAVCKDRIAREAMEMGCIIPTKL